MLKNRNLNVRVTSKTIEELESISILLGGIDRPLSKAATVERAISVLYKLSEIYWDDIVHFGIDYPEIAELVLNIRYTKPNDSFLSKNLVAEDIEEYNTSKE